MTKVKIIHYDCKPWCIGRTGTFVRDYELPEPGTLIRFDEQCPHKSGGLAPNPTQCFFEAGNSVLEVVEES